MPVKKQEAPGHANRPQRLANLLFLILLLAAVVLLFTNLSNAFAGLSASY